MELTSDKVESDDLISDSKLGIEFAELEDLFPVILTYHLYEFYLVWRVALQDKFESLTDGERHRILTLLRSDALRVRATLYSCEDLILNGQNAVDSFFDILCWPGYYYQPSDADDSGKAISALHMGPQFYEFDDKLCYLLAEVLPERFSALSTEELSEFEDKFNSLSYGVRNQILTFLGGCSSESMGNFHEILYARAEPTAVDAILHALLTAAAACNPPALTPQISVSDPSSASSVQSHSPRPAASLADDDHYLLKPAYVLTPSDAVDSGSSREAMLLPEGTMVLDELDISSNFFSKVLPKRFHALYSKELSEFQAMRISDYGDPGAFSSSPVAASHAYDNLCLALQRIKHSKNNASGARSLLHGSQALGAALYFPHAFTPLIADESSLSLCRRHFVYPSSASSSQSRSTRPAASLYRPLAHYSTNGGYHSRNPAVVLTPSDAVDSGWSREMISLPHGSLVFYDLLYKFLPQEFHAMSHKKFDEFQHKFESLTDRERNQILAFLGGCSPESINYFHRILNAGPIAVDAIFHALLMTAANRSEWQADPEHDRDIIIPADGIRQAIEISPFGDSGASSSSPESPTAGSYNAPYHTLQCPCAQPQRSQASDGTLPGHQREFYQMSNSLPNYASRIQSDFQRPEASANNPPADVGDTIIQVSAEARATRDDKTAGDSKYYGTLAPLNYTNAKKAFKILKSTHRGTLPFPIKTSGYLTVILSGAAFLLSLVGLGQSTIKPNALPYGCHSQRIMQILHNTVLHATAYAFIGTMCHDYLQDDPFLMCMVAGIAFAFFNAIMWYVAWRR